MNYNYKGQGQGQGQDQGFLYTQEVKGSWVRVEVADGKTAKTPTPLDIWIRDKFPITQETSWEDYMFWKSSRMFLLKQIQDEVNYKHVDQFDFIDRKKAQDTSG